MLSESRRVDTDNPNATSALIIWRSQVSEHLYSGLAEDATRPFGCVGNLAAFWEVWLFVDCPGLEDAVVVRELKNAGLWEVFDPQGQPVAE